MFVLVSGRGGNVRLDSSSDAPAAPPAAGVEAGVAPAEDDSGLGAAVPSSVWTRAMGDTAVTEESWSVLLLPTRVEDGGTGGGGGGGGGLDSWW